MGTGSTGNANALWVIGSFGSRPATPQAVTWPPAGFVPYQVVYSRWSFSVNTNVSVNFAGATVSMTRGGSPVSLTVFPNADGYGDKTIAWQPTGLSFTGGTADDVVSVQVNNVVGGGVSINYDYTVTVIDPARAALPTFTDNPLVPQTTQIKAQHITELRQAVTELRGRYGLGAFAWSDGTLTPAVSTITATHVVELRSALAAVYSAAGRPPPAYTTQPAPSRGDRHQGERRERTASGASRHLVKRMSPHAARRSSASVISLQCLATKMGATRALGSDEMTAQIRADSATSSSRSRQA